MSVAGTYKLTVNTQMGAQQSTLTLKEEGGSVSGTYASRMGSSDFSGGTIEGNAVKFDITLNAMGREFTLNCDATIDGDSIKGNLNTPMGGADFTGTREG